jgi:hypothetical protein
MNNDYKSLVDDSFKEAKDFEKSAFVVTYDVAKKLENKIIEQDQLIKLLCDDWAEDDTRIKEMCEPIVGKDFIDGDGYSFVCMVDVVEEVVKKYNVITARCEEFARNLYRVRKERNELKNEIEDDNAELDTAWSKVAELGEKLNLLVPYCFECGAEYDDKPCCPDHAVSYIHSRFLNKLKETKFGVQEFKS